MTEGAPKGWMIEDYFDALLELVNTTHPEYSLYTLTIDDIRQSFIDTVLTMPIAPCTGDYPECYEKPPE